MHTLIKFNSDWADEFDCQEFIIFDKSKEEIDNLLKEWLSFKIEIPEILDDDEFDEDEFIQNLQDNGLSDEMYFGTNEYFERNKLSINNFEILEISKQEKETIEKYLGNNFGTGILNYFENFVNSK